MNKHAYSASKQTHLSLAEYSHFRIDTLPFLMQCIFLTLFLSVLTYVYEQMQQKNT